MKKYPPLLHGRLQNVLEVFFALHQHQVEIEPFGHAGEVSGAVRDFFGSGRIDSQHFQEGFVQGHARCHAHENVLAVLGQIVAQCFQGFVRGDGLDCGNQRFRHACREEFFFPQRGQRIGVGLLLRGGSRLRRALQLLDVEQLEHAGLRMHFESLVFRPRVGLVVGVDVHHQVGVALFRRDDHRPVAVGKVRAPHLGVRHGFLQLVQVQCRVGGVALETVDELRHFLLHLGGKLVKSLENVSMHHQLGHV